MQKSIKNAPNLFQNPAYEKFSNCFSSQRQGKFLKIMAWMYIKAIGIPLLFNDENPEFEAGNLLTVKILSGARDGR
jgi:hypothetical protein